MLHLRSFTGSQYTLSVEMLLDLVNRISPERKVEKNLDIHVWILSRASRRRPENVLGTSRTHHPGTFLESQIKTSPGRQIGTSPGWSNRIFKGSPGDVRGALPRDVLGTNICLLGCTHFLAINLGISSSVVPKKVCDFLVFHFYTVSKQS